MLRSSPELQLQRLVVARRQVAVANAKVRTAPRTVLGLAVWGQEAIVGRIPTCMRSALPSWPAHDTLQMSVIYWNHQHACAFCLHSYVPHQHYRPAAHSACLVPAGAQAVEFQLMTPITCGSNKDPYNEVEHVLLQVLRHHDPELVGDARLWSYARACARLWAVARRLPSVTRH